MPTDDDHGAAYDTAQPQYDRLLEEVRFALEQGIRTAGFKIHSINGRVKDRAGFVEKVERKGYADPLLQMPDIAGIRVVCLFIDDLQRVGAIIDDVFVVIEREDKAAQRSADAFGYTSIHYVCQLGSTNQGPRYDGLHDLQFEVQVRTILMDAWANVSHHLAYKGEASIPEDLRRDFYALSGLFHVADRHFKMLSDAAEQTDRNAETELASSGHSDTRGGEMPIDRSTVRATLRHLYADREEATAASVSSFVEELTEFGRFAHVGELRAALDGTQPLMNDYEQDNPPSHYIDPDEPGRLVTPTRYNDVGAARLALGMLDKEFLTARTAAERAESWSTKTNTSWRSRTALRLRR